MTAGVPWSVNAVERETWAAARDAARRAGLSVGEWLEQTIRQGADEPHAHRTAREQPRADALEQRLDDISEQLDHLLRNGPQRVQPERAARTDPALAAAVAALDNRIEALMRDIGAAERLVPSGKWTPRSNAARSRSHSFPRDRTDEPPRRARARAPDPEHDLAVDRRSRRRHR